LMRGLLEANLVRQRMLSPGPQALSEIEPATYESMERFADRWLLVSLENKVSVAYLMRSISLIPILS
jgi:hypothetical protein